MSNSTKPSPVILLAEDNPDTAENLQLYLQHHHMQCVLAADGKQALSLFAQTQPDLLLLDWMMPKLSGVEVCGQIRRQSQVPIIMITARISSDDLVLGLEAGADEYVKKPFEHKELLARINAHLRRAKTNQELGMSGQMGPWQWQEAEQIILFCGQALKLTKTEYKLLMMLLKSPGRVFSREQLFVAVFGYDSDSSDRTVDVHLHNARKKLAEIDGQEHGITAIYGVGYKLQVET